MYSLKKIIILSFILAIFGFGGNVVFGKGLTNNIISQSIKNALTDDNKNIIETVNQYVADDKKIALIQTDTELTEALNGLTNFDPIYLQNILQTTSDIAGAENGFTGDLQLYAMLNSGKGYSYTDQYGNIIGVNTIKTDLTDSGEIINLLFHETTNYNDHSQNEQTAINRGSTAEAIWALKNFEKENANKQTTEDWNKKNINSSVILYGTLNAYKNNIEAISSPNAHINNFFTPDTLADIGFISYDLYKIIAENIIGDQANLKENIIALGADAAGFFIPLATGLGTATKAANKIDNVIDGAAKAAKADEVIEGVVKYGDGAGSGIQKFYPDNNGFLGNSQRKYLIPGEKIDRYGGNDYSKFFSPQGTPKSARALPPGTSEQPLRTFEIVKPFEVEAGNVAPAFNEIGLGTQYKTPVNLKILLDRGIIQEIK